MAKFKFTKLIKLLIYALLLTTIVVGGIYMFNLTKKSEEEHRNKEYEISLVKVLKYSYEGIEEIEIKNPSYSSIPSDAWGADVKFTFSDGSSKEHVLAYDKDANKIKIGVYNNEDEEFQSVMDSRRGSTKSRVKVRYSDGSEEEQ